MLVHYMHGMPALCNRLRTELTFMRGQGMRTGGAGLDY